MALLHRGRLLPDVQSVTKQDLCYPIIIAGIFLEQDGAKQSFFFSQPTDTFFFFVRGMIFIQINRFQLLHCYMMATLKLSWKCFIMPSFIFCYILNAYCVVFIVLPLS